MKKAFDSNVAKFKPRLRPSGPGTTTTESAPEADAEPGDTDVIAQAAEAEGVVASAESVAVREADDLAEAALERAEDAPTEKTPTRPLPNARAGVRAAPPKPLVEAAPAEESIADRRERLERVKRRVKEAAAPTVIVVPATTPTAAGESALSLLKDLESQLAHSRANEDALRRDLNDARAEQARMANEASRTHERLVAAERSLDEKRAVLAELLAEMSALEEERDDAVRRAQSLSLLDEERAGVLADASGELEAAKGELKTAQAEIDRLSGDLDARAADTARLRAALSELTRERDQVVRELGAVRRERDELSEARRALEQVHEALAQVRSKLV